MRPLTNAIERNALRDRLARLERASRPSRGLLVGSAVEVALLLLCGTRREEQAGVIQGERLMLKNEAGDSGIVMKIGGDGAPVIDLQRSIGGRASSM